MDQLILPPSECNDSAELSSSSCYFDTRFSDFDPALILDTTQTLADSDTTSSTTTKTTPPPYPPFLEDTASGPNQPPPGSAQFKIGQAGSITVNFIFCNDGHVTSSSSGDGSSSSSSDWWKSYVEEILASFKVSNNNSGSSEPNNAPDEGNNPPAKSGTCHVVVKQEENTTVNIRVQQQSTDKYKFYAKYSHEIRWLAYVLVFIVICIILRVVWYINGIW